MCYGADFRNRHAYFGGALSQDRPSPYALEGFALLLDHLFSEFDFIKLYGTSLEPNIMSYHSAIGSIVHEEGRLRRHEFFNGEYRDLLNFAIYRDEWLAMRFSEESQLHKSLDNRVSLLSQATTAGAGTSRLAERLRASVGRSERDQGSSP
jgi:hypothetical protein